MALHLASLETGAWSNSEMTYSLHEELQSSSYVCCVQSPWAHLLEKQVFQKGMFDPKTNEIGLKTFKVLCSRAVLFCYVQQDFSPLMRANFSDPKAGRFMNYSCSRSHKTMRPKVTWSIKHSRLTLTLGGKLKSKSFKRGKSNAFATVSLARSLRSL